MNRAPNIHDLALPTPPRYPLSSCVIGVDFDNTIISYDDVLSVVALESGLIRPGLARSKREIRNAICQLAGGEVEWQKLQAMVYGPRIGEAKLSCGVRTFFALCRQQGVKVYIISHKTEFANYDETGTNLRQAALEWMDKRGFFSTEGLGLSRDAVIFEATRWGKITRVGDLGCTHFIDDLEEVFLEDSFPKGIERILYCPGAETPAVPEVRVVNTWKEICDFFFDAKA